MLSPSIGGSGDTSFPQVLAANGWIQQDSAVQEHGVTRPSIANMLSPYFWRDSGHAFLPAILCK